MKCPACNSITLSGIGQKNSYSLLRCEKCGMVTVSPLPSEEELLMFYQHYDGNKGYLKKKASKLKRSTKRIKRLMRLTNGRRFLDVGCNVGYAVESARHLGFQSTGIDLDPESIEIACSMFPGGRYITSSIQAMADRQEKFDVIYCAEVIEHVPDPKAFADSLFALLDAGGVLFLTTPDSSHFRVPGTFSEWAEVKPPEHIQYFSRSAMKYLLESSGFKQVRFRPNLKPGLRVVAKPE